ncbi:MAG: CBS domain-containing protein [Gammaproteobacteria bacterium]
MGAVLNLLDSKGHDVLTVDPDTSVREAIEKMEAISAGTVVVMEGGAVVGMVSERDVIRKVVLQDQKIDKVKVRELMSTDLTTITPETSLDDCMQLITEKRIRHLPVLCNGSLCGIVSIGDVVKYLIVEKDFKIRNLEAYISG